MVFATTLLTIVARAAGSIAAVAKSTAVTLCGAFSLTQPQISVWTSCFCVAVINRVTVCQAGTLFNSVVHFALIAIFKAAVPNCWLVLGWVFSGPVAAHAERSRARGAITANIFFIRMSFFK